MRTVYLGTSDFAAAVLEHLAAGPHRPALVISRPDRPRGRGRRLQSPPVVATARTLGLDVAQPEALHAPETLERIAAVRPDALVVCAYGVLVREPLLSAYEIFNVHPSLLPRWRGAAPVERAITAGDERTGVSIMRLVQELDAGPVCLAGEAPIRCDDDYGTLSARLQVLAGELLVRALEERPPWVEQDPAGVTYAAKIEAADRALDPVRTPGELERVVRALRPHIGARIALPGGGFLGVGAARPAGPTAVPAGGRLRAEGERLLLDCRGGALELLEVQPPGGRPMPSREWLRGRPDPALTGFAADPALPGVALGDLVTAAVAEWGEPPEAWTPHLDALAWRGTPDVLAALDALAADASPAARAVAAHAAGQLGAWRRLLARESARLLDDLGEREGDPEVLAVVAEAFGHLGEPWGLAWLLRARRHPDAEVRAAVASGLRERESPLALDALVALVADRDPRTRETAVRALGAGAPADTPALRDALARALEDADPEIRLAAAHGLALRDDPRGAPAVRALLEDDGVRAAPAARALLAEAAQRTAAADGAR